MDYFLPITKDSVPDSKVWKFQLWTAEHLYNLLSRDQREKRRKKIFVIFTSLNKSQLWLTRLWYQFRTLSLYFSWDLAKKILFLILELRPRLLEKSDMDRDQIFFLRVWVATLRLQMRLFNQTCWHWWKENWCLSVDQSRSRLCFPHRK